MSIMSNQPLDMDAGATYECPHCHCDILQSNEPTHDAICARRHAAGNQRQVQPQIIKRESSSSGLPEPVEPTISNRRSQVREERNIANNKLITCPNCEKSVREQSFNDHAANECQGSDKIPCEFCDKAIPISSYVHHVEDVHRREREEEQERHEQRRRQQQQDEEQLRQEQEQEQQRERRQRSSERPVSPGRGGMASRENQSAQESRSQAQGMPEQRDRSPGRNATQEQPGGFMGFLRSLVHNANENRSEPMERPQQVERPQPERSQPSEQPQSRSFLSRLLLGGDHDESEQRSRPTTMEDFFLRAIQNRQEAQRAQAREREEQRHSHLMSHSQNPFASQPSSNRSVRTIRLGPHGTLVISNGRSAMEEPEDVWQSVGAPPQRRQDGLSMGPMSMGEMGPMGLILQMLAARGQGMPVPFNLSQDQLSQIQEEGLSKQDIESLSIVKYDTEKNKNLSEDMKSCPICLEEFENGSEVKFLWCLHRFHRKCVDQWLEKHTNCPICKKDFSEINEQNFTE